jgi:acetate kinase
MTESQRRAEQAILVVNAGSSSLKFSVYRVADQGELEETARGLLDGIGVRPHFSARVLGDGKEEKRDLAASEAGDHGGAIAIVAEWLRGHLAGALPIAVGHRVVHGGIAYAEPVLVDDTVMAALEALVPLAPLHQPHNLAAIRAIGERFPGLRQVACFDTAFHRGHPQVADLFALPFELYEAGVRRYGFHGLSYEYIAHVLPIVAPEIAHGKVVVAHLGNGASLCALQDGRSMDSTMTFTALDGLPMGTRTGALDPAAVLYLLQERHMSAKEIEDLLYKKSGLLGLSGVSSDMRELLASPEPRARLALDYFVYRIAREVGGLSSVLGGLHGLVFTAGIGEHAAPIRARVCDRLAWLGITLDAAANAAHGPRITAPGSRASAWVIPTDEEQMVARHTLAMLDRA